MTASALARRLGKAVATRDIEGCRRALAAGASPDSEWNDYLPLVEAVRLGDHELVDILLVAGAGVQEFETATGLQAIHPAAIHGHEAIAALLLERGANVNAKSADGRTPLHECARHSGRSVVRSIDWLVGWGADVNARDAEGRTALTIISLSPEKAMAEEAVDRLLWNSAHVNEDVHGLSLLAAVQELARQGGVAEDGAREIALRLRAKGAIATRIPEIVRAVEARDTREVERLLERGANPNEKAVFGTGDILTEAFSRPRLGVGRTLGIADALLRAGAIASSSHLHSLLAGPVRKLDPPLEDLADFVDRLVDAGATWNHRVEGEPLFRLVAGNRVVPIVMKRVFARSDGVRSRAAKSLGLSSGQFKRLWDKYEQLGWFDEPTEPTPRSPPIDCPRGRKVCRKCREVSFDVVPKCPSCKAERWWFPAD